MEKRTFELITAIQAECTESWGTCENVETVGYFGTKESVFLEGQYIYVYYDIDKIFAFIDKVKPDIVFTIDERCNLHLYKV